ncbi:MAG TPA: hypothetical protein VK400_06020 [Pyrinomonadaceae bacterium]|nr:hypothetical protein [Pyrinomonadaceae bacterium]
MTPKEFVELFYRNKTEYLRACLAENSGVFVSSRIKSLNLSDEQKEVMAQIVDEILTDVYYSILLGIDGCAAIGGYQCDYKLYDEDGNLLTNGGEIEGLAWEYFHEKE